MYLDYNATTPVAAEDLAEAAAAIIQAAQSRRVVRRAYE